MSYAGTLGSLRHRTCSSQAAGACWEYSPVRGFDGPTIYARILQGARAFDVEIPVCSSLKPKPGAWPIRRLSEDTWRISCARYGRNVEIGGDMTEPAAFAKGLAVGSLEITGAPPDVQADLAAL